MRGYLPIIQWLKNYQRSYFSGDLFAGLTIGVMLVPQGMAYALLAGLPPIYGLYASTIPLLVYAIFGTSRQLAVGPVAMIALLLSSGLGQFAELGSTTFISLAILLAFLVGTIQLLMGLFRIGFLVNFLSHPVITGFTFAAALIIGLSQVKHLLGIDIPRGNVAETLIHIVQHIHELNWPTFLLGSLAMLILFGIKRLKKRLPGPLIVVALGIIGVVQFQLVDSGVKIVGAVPGGWPAFAW
ncbi:MAG: SulP family inorganic anion transporter, partial [Bacteroidota bacterium]